MPGCLSSPKIAVNGGGDCHKQPHPFPCDDAASDKVGETGATCNAYVLGACIRAIQAQEHMSPAQPVPVACYGLEVERSSTVDLDSEVARESSPSDMSETITDIIGNNLRMRNWKQAERKHTGW